MGFDLVCIGDVTFDIISYPLRKYPVKDEQISSEEPIKFQIGGGAAISACAASNLGMKTCIFGKVGKDFAGTFLMEKILRNGVCSFLTHSNKETAKSIVITFRDGSRSIINFGGTNKELGIDDIDMEVVRNSENLLISGFFHLEKFQENCWKVLREAKKSGVTTYLDVPTLKTRKLATLYKCFKSLDYLFVNEKELRIVTREREWKKGVRKLAEKYGVKVVLHRGRKGSAYCEGGKIWSKKAYKVEPMNPTGAGDVFDSAFIFSTHKKFQIEERLKFAEAAASIYLMNRKQKFPNSREVRKFMEKF